MIVNYDRGDLFSRVAIVLFLGSILFVLLFFASPILDTLGQDGGGDYPANYLLYFSFHSRNRFFFTLASSSVCP